MKISRYDKYWIIIIISILVIILVIIIIIDYVKNKKYWLFYEAKKTLLEKIYITIYFFVLFDVYALMFYLYK